MNKKSNSVFLENAVVFVDDKAHCIRSGEIELPIKQGVLSEDKICGELGELILGNAVGRSSNEDITFFDSTGMALVDLAAANCLLKKL